MTFVEKINAVLQKLVSCSPYSINTCGNNERCVLELTREEFSIICMCCYQVVMMIDHQAKIEPNIHITIIDADKKGK